MRGWAGWKRMSAGVSGDGFMVCGSGVDGTKILFPCRSLLQVCQPLVPSYVIVAYLCRAVFHARTVEYIIRLMVDTYVSS